MPVHCVSDAASELTGITYMPGSNTLGALTYAYDLAGRRTVVGGSYARTTYQPFDPNQTLIPIGDGIYYAPGDDPSWWPGYPQ
jgi:hypothetical protein